MKQKREEMPPVNVHNDAEMVGLRLRKPVLSHRDPAVWTKSNTDREALKFYKGLRYTTATKALPPVTPSGFTGKLVVYLTNLPKGEKRFKSTLSFTCDRNEIYSVLREYTNRRDGIEILKYSWNGKTYYGKEIPPRINRGGRISA